MSSNKLAHSCIVCIFILLGGAGASSAATNYYVSVLGNDSNGGTQVSPWLTIANALTLVSVGDTINVGPGTYTNYWYQITEPITLSGSDVYQAGNQPLQRHQSLTILRPPPGPPDFPFIHVKTNGVVIQNLTINGIPPGAGTPSVKDGVYTEYRPLTVSNCVIANISGYGIRQRGYYPPPGTNDAESLRGYFAYNMITNITHTNLSKATGISLDQAPAICEYNEFAAINGTNAYAAIYMVHCWFNTNALIPITIANNYFEDCLVAIWANECNGEGEPIHILDNTVTDSLIGIRLTAARGQAIISGNSISVGGVSPSSNATPARAIWVQADRHPWSTNSNAGTDHQVVNNTLIGSGTNGVGAVGLLFEYDDPFLSGFNNGVHATAMSNSVSGFDIAAFIESGSSGVGETNSPLVDVEFRFNNFTDYGSYAMFATGVEITVSALSNWWGSYEGLPPGAVTTNVPTGSIVLGAYGTDTDNDGTDDYLDDDDDGDGLVDTNEVAIGTIADNPDTDGDGLNDGDEILAGTDPTNQLSCFTMSMETAAGPGFDITWTSVSNRQYKLYRATDLMSGFVLPPLTNVTAIQASTTYTDTNAPGSGPYYYRVSVTN